MANTGIEPIPAAAMADRCVRPKVLFFDVNDTLLDLSVMRESVGSVLRGRPDLLPLWFTTMLQHALVETVAGRYHDFGVIGVAALTMVARNHDISLSEEEAQRAIAPIRSLPPHGDVAPALKTLHEAGFRMVALTNSSRAAIEAQIDNAGFADFFERKLSVEDVLVFKPHTLVYRSAAHKMGIDGSECMLIAAHGRCLVGGMAHGISVAAGRAALPPGAPAGDRGAQHVESCGKADRACRLRAPPQGDERRVSASNAHHVQQ